MKAKRCLSCGQIIDEAALEYYAELEGNLSIDRDIEAQLDRLYGLCSDCMGKLEEW